MIIKQSGKKSIQQQMREYRFSCKKSLKQKFKQYQVLLGENKLWFVAVFPFFMTFIGLIPVKILYLIIRAVVKMYQFVCRILKYCFGKGKSKEQSEPQSQMQSFLIPIRYVHQRENLQISINEDSQSKKIKQQMMEIEKYFLSRKFPKNHFNLFTPIYPNDPDRVRFTKVFKRYRESITLDPTFKIDPKELKLDYKESRAIGVMLGMAINDSLGANMEFQPYKKESYKIITNEFQDIRNAINDGRLTDLRINQVGIWTDDASMGLAMGYALMMNNYEFDPIKTREMFHLWWYHGLGNGGRQESLGLGGNISIAIEEFNEPNAYAYTSKGKEDRNGNGSLMRLAPVPIVFHRDKKEASKVAMLQSLTTHNGLEAKECCRLMNEIIIDLINRKENQDWKNILKKTCDNFSSKVKSVECLAKGQKETDEIVNQQKDKIPDFEVFNRSLMDRKWNWRESGFQYSPTRLKNNANYIGSYCMDALAMALNVVYFTGSFKEIAVKIADQGGDCDTVGAIAGQIAGAIYGVNEDMLRLYSEMEDFKKGRYEVFLVGYSLYHKKEINLKKGESNSLNSEQEELIEKKRCG